MSAYLPRLRERITALIGDRKGVTTLEYAVIAGVTVVATGLALVGVGTKLQAMWTAIGGYLTATG